MLKVAHAYERSTAWHKERPNPNIATRSNAVDACLLHYSL